MTILLLLGVLFVALPATILAQDPPNREERFFDWARMTFPAAEYANRRDGMVVALRQNGGGVFLAPSDFPVGGPTFRQLDDFLYFTGLELPSSILVVDAGVAVTHRGQAAVRVGPAGKAVKAIRVQAGVQDDDGVFKQVVDIFRAGCRQVPGNDGCGVGATGLVTMHAVTQPYNPWRIRVG